MTIDRHEVCLPAVLNANYSPWRLVLVTVGFLHLDDT